MKSLWCLFFVIASNSLFALSPLPPEQGQTKSVTAGMEQLREVPREQVIQQLFDLSSFPQLEVLHDYFSTNADLDVAEALLERLEIEIDNPDVGQLIDLCEQGPNSLIDAGISILMSASNRYPDEFSGFKSYLLNHNIDYIAMTAKFNSAQIDGDKSLLAKVNQRCSDFFPAEITTFMSYLYSVNCDGLTQNQVAATLRSYDGRKASRVVQLLKCFPKESAQQVVKDFIEYSWPPKNYFAFSDMRELTRENSREFEWAGRTWFRLFKWLVKNDAHEIMPDWAARAQGDLKFVLEAFLLMAGYQERLAPFKQNYCILQEEKVLSEVNKILERFNEDCSSARQAPE